MRNLKPELVLKAALLVAAFASFLLSVTLYFRSDDLDGRMNGLYVGIWVPSILALGGFILSGNRGSSDE